MTMPSGTTECIFLLDQDFKAVMWESRALNPEHRTDTAMRGRLDEVQLRIARSATWSLAGFGVDEDDPAGKFGLHYDRFRMADQQSSREDLRP